MADRPVDILREMRDRLGDLPAQLARVLANQNTTRPGFGAGGQVAGAGGFRDRRPELYRSTERLTGALGAFVPGFSELSQFLRNLRELGDAFQEFTSHFRRERPRGYQGPPPPRRPPSGSSGMPGRSGPSPRGGGRLGSFSGSRGPSAGSPVRHPAPASPFRDRRPRRPVVTVVPSPALPAPRQLVPLGGAPPAVVAPRAARLPAPPGLFAGPGGGAMVVGGQQISPALASLLTILGQLVQETQKLREAYQQENRDSNDGTDDAERKRGDEPKAIRPSAAPQAKSESGIFRMSESGPGVFRVPIPRGPFRPQRNVPGPDAAEKGEGKTGFIDTFLRGLNIL